MAKIKFNDLGFAYVAFYVKHQDTSTMFQRFYKVDTGANCTTISKDWLLELGYDEEWIKTGKRLEGDARPTVASGLPLDDCYQVILPEIHIGGWWAITGLYLLAHGLLGGKSVRMIHCYDDFIKALQAAGFSMGGKNKEGFYTIITWAWNESPPYETPVSWYTGDPETDPSEWRMRILAKPSEVAYGKVFFDKTGFITKEWYPYFLAVRRGGMTFDEAYESGTISHAAKRIYDIALIHDSIPVDEIKRLGGFSREDKSVFDRALTELQMKMYLTICGNHQKRSMPSNVFCTTERFFGDSMFNEADKISKEQAFEKIRAQVLKLNPGAQDKKISKFILG